jgi:hypothetical protein
MKKNKLPKELTTVTTVSKLLALLMFISLPIIAFQYGRNIQSRNDALKMADMLVVQQVRLNDLYAELRECR